MNKEKTFEELLEYFKKSNKNQFGYEQDKLISYEEAQIILQKLDKQKEVLDKIKEVLKNYEDIKKGLIKKSRIEEILEEIE